MKFISVMSALALILGGCGEARPTYQSAQASAHEYAGELEYLDVGHKTDCTSDCTSDCSGHEAGFEWAKENGINESGDCPSSGNPSFLEGCEAYGDYIAGTIEEMTD